MSRVFDHDGDGVAVHDGRGRVQPEPLDVGDEQVDELAEVVAEYAYEYEGRSYVGTRVGLHTSADNIGSYHQDAHNELKRYRTEAEAYSPDG